MSADELIQNATYFSSGKLNPRCQVDIIDMRGEQALDYKFILAYEDQTSKFIILRPLRTRDPKEVATELLDVFTIVGAPRVVQSGNGRVFASQIVQELRRLWVDLIIVHGEVESVFTTSKRDFLKSVKLWLEKNPSKLWSEALKFVQFIENTTFCCGSAKTPHEMLFKTNEPIITFSTSGHILTKIWTEEDWDQLITSHSKNGENINFTSNSKQQDSNLNRNKITSELRFQFEETNSDEDNRNDRQDAEQLKKNRRLITSCEISSGFKFVNVKSGNSIHVEHAEDSQSGSEGHSASESKSKPTEKYQLKCKICQKRYMKLGHLKNHLKSHTKANGFECTICCKKFRLAKVHDQHMRRFHNSNTALKISENVCLKESLKGDLEDNSKSTRLSEEKCDIEPPENSRIRKETNHKTQKRLQRSGNNRLSKELRSTKFNNTSLLECSYCQQKFDFPSVLKRHVRSHTNERPYVCEVCNKSFKQLGHLSQHSLTHTDYRSFQCAICSIKLQSLEALKVHSQTHRGDSTVYRSKEIYRLFECDSCKKVFTTKSVLERHIFTHTHERQFGCKVCGKRFKQAGHVKSHMLVHTGERKFECKVCSKRFSLSNSLKKHMYIHNGEKPYQCDVCGARFLEKRNLTGHLMTHTNERPFSCKICGKRYTLADTLRRHISAAHEDGRTYQCEICAKMFKQLAHLYVHKKVHTDERPYQCHLCDKNFKHKNVLKSHLAIHANLRPFECEVCKATFVRKTNLQTHIASAHMNERPYVCTICNKRFKQVSHLNGHVIVHSNSMPYQCDFCDRRCNRLDNLKKHMRLHTKTKE